MIITLDIPDMRPRSGIPTFRGAFVFFTKVSRPSDSFRNLDVAEGTKLEAEGEGGESKIGSGSWGGKIKLTLFGGSSLME